MDLVHSESWLEQWEVRDLCRKICSGHLWAISQVLGYARQMEFHPIHVWVCLVRKCCTRPHDSWQCCCTSKYKQVPTKYSYQSKTWILQRFCQEHWGHKCVRSSRLGVAWEFGQVAIWLIFQAIIVLRLWQGSSGFFMSTAAGWTPRSFATWNAGSDKEGSFHRNNLTDHWNGISAACVKKGLEESNAYVL